MQAAADVAEQARQKRHHGPRHAGHFDEEPKEDEQRHGEQDQMAHAFVHPPDQHHQRCARRQRQIAEDRKPEGEGNRQARKHAKTGDADKEDDEVDIAERTQPGLRQPEQADQHGDRQHRRKEHLDIAGARQPQHRKQRHQADTDRQRRGAPGVGNLQRRRGDEAFLVGVVVRRPHDQQQECQRGAGRDHIEIGAHRGPDAGDDRRHPHVLGAAERDRGPQHRKPQEQHRRQFVRPDQRLVQHIARDDARKQNDDFGDDQDRRGYLHQQSQPSLDGRNKRTRTRRGLNRHLGDGDLADFDMSHWRPHHATTVCRPPSPGFPTPGRRICLSIRHRNQRNAVCRGTARHWAG